MDKQVVSHAVLVEEANKSIVLLKIVGIIFGVAMAPMLLMMFAEPLIILIFGIFGIFAFVAVKKVKEYNNAIRTGNFTIYESRVTNKYSRRRNKSRSYYLAFENGSRQSLQYHEYVDAKIGEVRYIIVNDATHDVFKSYDVEKYILHEELYQNLAQ